MCTVAAEEVAGLIQQVGGNSNVNGHAERTIATGVKNEKNTAFLGKYGLFYHFGAF